MCQSFFCTTLGGTVWAGCLLTMGIRVTVRDGSVRVTFNTRHGCPCMLGERGWPTSPSYRSPHCQVEWASRNSAARFLPSNGKRLVSRGVQREVRPARETDENFSLAGMEKTARFDEGANAIPGFRAFGITV